MEKRGLGRGLSALISTAGATEQSAVQEIELTQITPNPYQPRTLFDPLKMEDLVASIREHGILQPILVRRGALGKYQLVAGERRFRAAQIAGLEKIPALIHSVNEQQQLEIAIVENLQREDIGALEAARAYRRLIDEFQMTQDMVAKRVGKNRSTIANTLRLLQLPDAILESLEKSEITEGHARALLMAEDAKLLMLWQSVVKRGLSVRETERLARDSKLIPAPLARSSGSASTPREATSVSLSTSRTDANEASVTERLQQRLGTKVSLRRFGGASGRIEIDFFSDLELERVVEIILGES